MSAAERGHAIATIAARQRTIVTRAQLLQAGFSRSAIAHGLAVGRLHPVLRGIYALGCGQLPPLALEQAALLACGKRSFLSHGTAAAIWELRPTQSDGTHVSVVEGAVPSGRGICGHRVETIAPGELRRRDGLTLTSPARTMIDLTPRLSEDELQRALDAGLARQILSDREVRQVLARHPGQRGVARLRRLVDDEPKLMMTRSGAERLFLEVLRAGRLRMPEVNCRIGRFVVDFVWRAERVAVEIDGFRFHRGRRAFESDRRRDAELAAAGWIVLRFTWRQVTQERESVLVRVAQVLAARPAA